MDSDNDKYLKILKLELNNLIDDVSALIDYEKTLHENQQHSNYVYLENLVVLKDEIMGFQGILHELDNTFFQFDKSNITEELTMFIKSYVNKHGYPMAIYELIKRKIDKIEEIKGIL